MLRKTELRAVLGRRRLERLLAAGLLKPATVNGRRSSFHERDVRKALHKLERNPLAFIPHLPVSRPAGKAPKNPLSELDHLDLTGLL